MEQEKDLVFVDPCAVTPRRLGHGEMGDLAGGVMPVAVAVVSGVVTGVAVALIIY